MKTDLRSELKDIYTASVKTPKIVTVPKLKLLTIDGHGSPERTPSFQQSIEALYGLAYTLKFMLKKSNADHDFAVMPLEGLWWPPDGSAFLSAPDDFNWTLMITVPSFVTATHVRKAVEELRAKKDPPLLENVHLQEQKEGKSVQMMHIGPYAKEGPTVSALVEFAEAQGYAISGRHHEIYLSDPNKVAPEKLKTIVRYPVAKATQAAHAD